MLIPISILVEVPPDFNHLCHELGFSALLEKVAHREVQQYVDSIVDIHKIYALTQKES